jgi:hypothetical protein
MTVLDAVYGPDGLFVCSPAVAPTPPPEGTVFAGEVHVSVELPADGGWVFSGQAAAHARDGTVPDDAAHTAAAAVWDPSRTRLRHLPPLVVAFQLPPTYPSRSAPALRLRCRWLTDNEVRPCAQVGRGGGAPH